ncbi:MAG TPA: prephenate dehydrogenase/arogenate dehydrogenase family protein [Gemmatimonadaceae bacterium]|nr:prephenate dehydrogenase/arogenate dehydrogenase family protein [Gemmatimonadaceae bacterium]
MNTPSSVAVIGLGMMGGSVARAFAARGVRVAGYDSNPTHLDAAIAQGVVARRLSPKLEDVGDADAIVIAVHGDAAIEILRTLDKYAEHVGLITDVGSVKQAIVSAANELDLATRFVGSHPFAGDHRSGFGASRMGLFENQIVYLCPTEKTSAEALDFAQSLWTVLGASPELIDARAHDEMLAWSSHLPHVVSSALAIALAKKGIDRDQLGRGGQDVTRLAGGSTEMWMAILIENAEAIDAALSEMERELAEFREAIRQCDRNSLTQLFETGRDWSST